MSPCQHTSNWLDKETAAKVFDAAKNMGLAQYSVVFGGHTVPQPRLTAWCSDNGEGYRYSGQTTEPVSWPRLLLDVRTRLEKEFERKFPSVLVNYYRDGRDSVSWHTDDEKLFGNELLIATVSLGGTRKFQLRKPDKTKFEYLLADGDLLLMPAVVNKEWSHCIPKTTIEVAPRISLTYRTMDK